MTAKDIAKWMLEKLEEGNYLYQENIVYDIQATYGEEFVYFNENGNLAIDKKVLAEFKKLSGDNVVWERSGRLWRKREGYDEPGRQQS